MKVLYLVGILLAVYLLYGKSIYGKWKSWRVSQRAAKQKKIEATWTKAVRRRGPEPASPPQVKLTEGEIECYMLDRFDEGQAQRPEPEVPPQPRPSPPPAPASEPQAQPAPTALCSLPASSSDLHPDIERCACGSDLWQRMRWYVTAERKKFCIVTVCCTCGEPGETDHCACGSDLWRLAKWYVEKGGKEFYTVTVCCKCSEPHEEEPRTQYEPREKQPARLS